MWKVGENEHQSINIIYWVLETWHLQVQLIFSVFPLECTVCCHNLENGVFLEAVFLVRERSPGTWWKMHVPGTWPTWVPGFGSYWWIFITNMKLKCQFPLSFLTLVMWPLADASCNVGILYYLVFTISPKLISHFQDCLGLSTILHLVLGLLSRRNARIWETPGATYIKQLFLSQSSLYSTLFNSSFYCIVSLIQR